MSRRTTNQAKKREPLNSGNFHSYLTGYVQTMAGRKIALWLKEKRYTAKEADASYRTLNHWSELGLIEDDRKKEKGWRKFSTIEVVWLHIIAELRKFGLSIEQLLNVKASLDKESWTFDEIANPYTMEWGSMEFSLLEFYVATALIHKTAVYLRVQQNGEADLLTFSDYQQELRCSELTHHILIDLTLIIRKLFPSSSYAPSYGPLEDLSNEEMEMLFTLRTGNFQRVTAKMKSGKITMIEAEEFISGRKHIDILKDEDFQSITYEKQNGKVVSVTRTARKKL